MIKPILVTRVSEDTLEVITDYQTVIHSARAEVDLEVVQGEPKDGLLGSLWFLEGAIGSSRVTLNVTHNKTQEDTYEYTYAV